MDIYDDEALRRPKKLHPFLKRLPLELVHQIFQELPLLKILQILVHKDPYLNECVMTHLSWGKLFSDQEDIDRVLDLFILHSEICRFTNAATSSLAPAAVGWHFRDYSTILALGCNAPDFGFRTNQTQVRLGPQLKVAIDAAIPRRMCEVAMLAAHAATPYPGDNASLATRWEWVKEAKRNLNRAKSRQLTIVADLMSQYPEQVMLKGPFDPAQGQPRKNLKHLEDRLRHSARKALNHSKLVYSDGRFKSGCNLKIELIPYDRYLWFFMAVLEEHPILLEDGCISINDMFANLMINSSSDEPESVPFTYPAEIAAGITLVLEGLQFVYTGSPLFVVPRIWYVLLLCSTFFVLISVLRALQAVCLLIFSVS